MDIKPIAKQVFSVQLSLNEEEARALDAIVGYGYKEFMRVFREHLGKSYIEGHEKGAETMFESVRQSMPAALRRCDEARKVFNKTTSTEMDKRK